MRPAIADPSDPYQVRAAAVGLHPDLSRALLARLSPADYRNAGIAIKTALAETAETAVYVWPRQRKPEEALFKVRFVPGAAAGCRRYVVIGHQGRLADDSSTNGEVWHSAAPGAALIDRIASTGHASGAFPAIETGGRRSNLRGAAARLWPRFASTDAAAGSRSER